MHGLIMLQKQISFESFTLSTLFECRVCVRKLEKLVKLRTEVNGLVS